MARILVAEDEDDIRQIIEHVLTRDGHHVTTVNDGRAAVEMCEHDDFDLIVSDLMMPSLTGIEVAEQVQANQRGEVPFLLVTASATDEDLLQARRAGISGFMAKPFNIAELRNRVSALLPNPRDS
jgi:CheY-like chemotaxis protein